MNQGEWLGHVQRDMPPTEAWLEHFQGAAYHLFKREPLFFEVKTAGLNTRHIKQVIHQARGIQHVLADLAGLKGVLRAFRRQVQRQDL